jgi:hypothetical protein
MHGFPIPSDAALRSSPPTQEALRAVAESRRVGPSSVPIQKLSGAVVNSPSSSIAAQTAKGTIPTSMEEAVASAARPTAMNIEDEMPTADPASMDQATLERVRRERKNIQSRLRTARLRQQLDRIKFLPPEKWTAEEQRLISDSEKKRHKKNLRSRKRAVETKQEIDRILAIPEEERTAKDIAHYNLVMGQKKRKIEGDKLRRTRVKELGLPPDQKAPGVPARGPLPQAYQYMSEEQVKKHVQDQGDNA